MNKSDDGAAPEIETVSDVDEIETVYDGLDAEHQALFVQLAALVLEKNIGNVGDLG